MNRKCFKIKSKRILIKDRIVSGTICIKNNIIDSICEKYNQDVDYDLKDMLITPGFIDMHSDAIEKEIEPRTGVFFPLEGSIIDLDRKIKILGITTVFHAIAFETEIPGKIRSHEFSKNIIKKIKELHYGLDVNNLIHLRYDVSTYESIEIVKSLIEDGDVDLISIMDHSPGQGQFKSIEAWNHYFSSRYKLELDELELLKNKKMNKSVEHILKVIDLAKRHNLKVASHDDDTLEKLDFIYKAGITISEFPVSLEVAREAKKRNIAIGMGAPNVVRNKSQSGNIAARELIDMGLCDYLCSDYHPSSLLKAVYLLHKDMNMDLEQAFSFITYNPARILGLNDRGVIAQGKKADLVAIKDNDYPPEVVMTICNGKIVYSKDI